MQNNSCFIFPNPARSFIKVFCEAGGWVLDCCSVNGKYICFMQEICLDSGMYDVSMLVSGMYIITTQSGNIFFVKQQNPCERVFSLSFLSIISLL